MNENLVLEARNKAGNYFREGYNCAESLFKTFMEYVDPDMESDVLKIATGFGGGLGHAGCMCGALAGSAMILSLLRGRKDIQESREPAYELANDFHKVFEEKFGTTCCRALNPFEFDTREHLRNCLKITGTTAMLLMRFMQEKGLLDDEGQVL